MLIIKTVLEGIGLGVILMIVCFIGIRKGAVGMVHLYHRDVQERCIQMGLTTMERIKKRSLLMKLAFIVYIAYVLTAVYVINGTREFIPAALQCFAILFIMNLIDRFLIDELWVGYTKAWTIPGTEDLKPYINKQDRIMKWFMGTVGLALMSCIIAGIMSFVI